MALYEEQPSTSAEFEAKGIDIINRFFDEFYVMYKDEVEKHPNLPADVDHGATLLDTITSALITQINEKVKPLKVGVVVDVFISIMRPENWSQVQ